ncbi:hypothetical protein OJ998_30785 [Solirubrobacter taibaiensis]|nr:hypothetical protein [Solirubrobacter taibaiensis]
MDPMLDRVRAANPASETEFAGRANFDALELAPRKRHLRRWLTIPALSAIIAALVVFPNATPQASEVLKRATQAIAVDDDGILYARSDVQWGPTGGAPAGTQSREVWVQGDSAMRWREVGGNEEVFRVGKGITRRSPDGELRIERDMRMVPNEVFRAGGLLREAQTGTDVDLEETDDAYVLTWREKSGPPHWPTIEMTMWIDKETYEPLRFTDHSFGKDFEGKPFDQTYTEKIVEFKTLPDTPENRRLLTLQ